MRSPAAAARRGALLTSLAAVVLVGTVTDKTTGQPLPGVTVSAGAAHAVSQADGTFRLRGVRPGTATLTVQSNDVPPQRFSIRVRSTTTHADLVVCSTTLDYSCGQPQ